MEKIHRLIRWAVKEFLHIFPVFLFFLVAFTLINWTEAFLFQGAGVTAFSFLQVALAAALIAKIVLVVDHLPLIKRFHKEPLLYNILWKTAVYWIILLLIRLTMRVISLRESSFQADWLYFVYGPNWNVFISVQFYYLLLLFIFVTFQELTRKIGAKKMRKLFFGK